MSKERLEEMKELWDLGYTKFVPYLFDYASEQAERVQELESQLQASNNVRQRLKQRIVELESSKFIASSMRLAEQNKRYREALEKIVHQENLKETNVFGYDHEDISSYVEEVARKALEENK